VSLDDTRAVMNPKMFSDPDPNPNEVSCKISDPDPIIHGNVSYKCKKEGIIVLQYCYLPLVGI